MADMERGAGMATGMATEPSVREQVTIMVLTTIIAFGCVFGCLALLIAGWLEMADGVLSVRAGLSLPISFALTLWAGYTAMMLVCRPTRQGAMLLAARVLLAIAPLYIVPAL
jgi:succinate-acetate transporter protein